MWKKTSKIWPTKICFLQNNTNRGNQHNQGKVEQCRKIFQSTYSESDTSHTWPKSQEVTHPSTNIADCCLSSVIRWVLMTVCHNS